MYYGEVHGSSCKLKDKLEISTENGTNSEKKEAVLQSRKSKLYKKNYNMLISVVKIFA